MGEVSLGLRDAQLKHRSLQLPAAAPEHGMCCSLGRAEHNKPGQREVQFPHQPVCCISRPAEARGISRLICLRAYFILLQFLLPEVALEPGVSNTSQQ